PSAACVRSNGSVVKIGISCRRFRNVASSSEKYVELTLLLSSMRMRRASSRSWQFFGIELRRISIHKRTQVGHRTPQPDHELSKVGVNGAHFIESHFVNQLLENDRIVAIKIYRPFPIVQPDRSRHDL